MGYLAFGAYLSQTGTILDAINKFGGHAGSIIAKICSISMVSMLHVLLRKRYRKHFAHTHVSARVFFAFFILNTIDVYFPRLLISYFPLTIDSVNSGLTCV